MWGLNRIGCYGGKKHVEPTSASLALLHHLSLIERGKNANEVITTQRTWPNNELSVVYRTHMKCKIPPTIAHHPHLPSLR